MSFSPEQQAALNELSQKTLEQIQTETAIKWAYRAWAAYTFANGHMINGRREMMSAATHNAAEYEHEAIEHAALCGDDSVLAQVRTIVASAKNAFLTSS